jgi:hypothetical protein
VENKERWMELCEQASTEQDPERLLKFVQEINTLLEQKEALLKTGIPTPPGSENEGPRKTA